MKKFGWITWVVFVAVLIFLVPRLSEHEQLLAALGNGEWLWLLAAFAMMVLMYGATIELYRHSYRTVGIDYSFGYMTRVHFAAMFANIITPSVGLAGAALFVKDARHHGSSHVRGVLGYALESLFYQVGFVVVLLLVFAGVLLSGTNLDFTEIIVLLLILLLVFTQFFLYAMVFYKPQVLEKILNVLAKLSDHLSLKVRKKKVFPEGWSEGRVAEMKEVLTLMLNGRQGWARAVGLSVAAFIAQVLMCVFLLLSFRQQIGFPVLSGMLIGGSLAGAFFTGPHGVGVVEFGLTLILSHYGVDRGSAMLIAVAYRGLTFWIPFFVGFFAFRGLKMFEEKDEEKSKAEVPGEVDDL
jgi:uncharacterized protein (TIRG00374 family)